jgi:hypothetical protein
MNMDEELFSWLKTRSAEIDKRVSRLKDLILKGRKMNGR